MSDKLINLFAEELGIDPSKLSDSSSPENVETWDSLAAMRLVAAIESEFDVTLSAKEVMKMRTIGVAREVLRSKNVSF